VERSKPDGSARIGIIGAGAAGLATAYYLKKNGYKNVVVLEKLPRVGGMCRTITEDYKSFDLGANYLTPAYRRLRAIAREVGAETRVAAGYHATTVPDDPGQPLVYRPFLDEIRRDRTDPAKPISLWRLLRKIAKFVWLRARLRSVIDRPSFAGLAEHDEATDDPTQKLCVPFEVWLQRNDLLELRPLFEIPITMMGYGYLSETAAPYVLKFMSLGTFVPLALRPIPGVGRFFPWPRRFVHGYQRLWEDVAKRLNVLVDVEITRLARPDDAGAREAEDICIEFRHRGQALFDTAAHDAALRFDHVILACPLEPAVLGRFMELRQDERELFDRIKTVAYCVTTLHVDENLPVSVTCVLPFDETTIGKPWAVSQVYRESKLVQFYSQMRNEKDGADEVVRAAVKLVYRMGRSIPGWSPRGSRDPRPVGDSAERFRTFDCWPYFQHVSPTDFGKFYAGLEALQGQSRTYYVGGATNFELIEPILEYAKALVDREFPRRGSA
jgi:Flavin containing amine oxidoreductase